MITRYTTANGGVYEIDDTEKKYRKVTGGEHTKTIPTEWTPYRECNYPTGDNRLHVYTGTGHGLYTGRVISAQCVINGGAAVEDATN